MIGAAMPTAGPAPVVHAAPSPAQVPVTAPLPAAPGAAQQAAPVFNAHKTMMGFVNPVAPSAPAAPSAPSAPVAARSVAVASAQNTMMGVVSPVPQGSRGRAELPPMIGGAAPGVPPSGAMIVGSGAATQMLSSVPDDYDPLGRKKKSATQGGARTGLWVVVGLVLAVTAGGAIWFALREHPAPVIPPLQAQIESTDAGLAMTVSLPGQPAGTVVRYGQQRRTLDAQGHVRFSLDDIGTRVGTIDLPIDVTPPNAATTRRTARIVLAYRVEPDLAGLGAEPPTARLVFHVPPGAHLRIDGQPVATDASGNGAATLSTIAPIAVDGPAAHEQTLRVQVQAADGTAAEGSYSLRVPRTALALERPTEATVLTAAARFVVRGHAPQATRVTINGEPAVVQNGTFESVIPLPTPGRVPMDIVAFAAGAAPARMHLDIERVAPTDTAAFGRFLATSNAGIADLAGGTLVAGRRVHFTGRVLGAPREHESGQTFQLVVNDRACPGGHCLAWVDTEPGLAPATDAIADVIGTVTGRRTSVTAGGERRSDPVIHAAVVR